MKREDEFLRMFPDVMRATFRKAAARTERLQEIRLRVGEPIMLYGSGREYYLAEDGEFLYGAGGAFKPDRMYLDRLLSHLCGYSVYAYEDEIRCGYLTVPGGHRIGLCGEAILEGDHISGMKNLSAMNIRISHQIKGAADKVIDWLYDKETFLNTLIISPPGCGKTTLLRDLIRQISDGNGERRGVSISVVDERCEIGGSFDGQMHNDLGSRTDLLSGAPKSEGMFLMLRSMNPSVIAVDEIGGKEDAEAIGQALRCGCGVIATLHGNDPAQLMERKYIGELIQDKVFARYVLLKKGRRPGVVDKVLDAGLKELYAPDADPAERRRTEINAAKNSEREIYEDKKEQAV